MEQAVATADHANAALTTMEEPTFTGSCGLYFDGVGGPSGTGGQTCYLVDPGAMAVGEANNVGSTARATGNDGRMSQSTCPAVDVK